MLLHKSNLNKYQWGNEQQEAFDKLVEKLCDKPVLTLYDYNACHEVHTDASSIGLAGVLLQSYDQKQWRPVFYFSRHCSEVESRYHAYELEVLAAVETLTRFRVYLLGKHFRLITDCSALAKVRDGKELLPKIARWYMKLLEYNFEAVHRPAARLSHVDALSRAPVEAPAEVTTAGFVAQIEQNQSDWLLTMQLQDKKVAEIIAVLNGKATSAQEVQLKADYQHKNSRLYRKENGLKFVVPAAVRWRIVKYCHDDAGHFSLEKTIARVRQHYWFPRIRKYVREYLSVCVECCYNKAKGGKSEGRMHFDEIEPIPFGTVHIDHLGPFIKSSRGMTHTLAISDAFSKYLIVKAVRSVKSNPVIVALNELTSYFGLPKRIVTDRGTAFSSKVFADYCNLNNIQHIQTAVRTPRANGQVERANQLILAYLRTSTENPRHWDQMLRELQWTVNSQQNSTTGFTPNELVFDFRLRDVLQNRIIAAIQDDMPLEEDQTINEKREVAAQRITAERERWKNRFDKKHQQPTVFEVDDLVVIAHEPPATGESRKLAAKYRGPYIVTKVLGKDRYVIGDIPGIQVTQRQFDSVYSSDKMKRWCSHSPELDAQPEDDDEDVQDTSLEDEPVSA